MAGVTARRRPTHRSWAQTVGLVFVGLVALFSLPLGALPAGSGSSTFPALRSPVCDPGLRVGPATVEAPRAPAEVRPDRARVARVVRVVVAPSPTKGAVRPDATPLRVGGVPDIPPRAVCRAVPVPRGPPSSG